MPAACYKKTLFVTHILVTRTLARTFSMHPPTPVAFLPASSSALATTISSYSNEHTGGLTVPGSTQFHQASLSPISHIFVTAHISHTHMSSAIPVPDIHIQEQHTQKRYFAYRCSKLVHPIPALPSHVHRGTQPMMASNQTDNVGFTRGEGSTSSTKGRTRNKRTLHKRSPKKAHLPPYEFARGRLPDGTEPPSKPMPIHDVSVHANDSEEVYLTALDQLPIHAFLAPLDPSPFSPQALFHHERFTKMLKQAYYLVCTYILDHRD